VDECKPLTAGQTAAAYAAALAKHDFRYDIQISQVTRLSHKFSTGVSGTAAAGAYTRPLLSAT